MREVGRADHASTEQLSALLDGRAEPDEQGFLADHVDRCVVCSNQLSDLRSVRALLRALPVHLPPRSFTLPVEPAAPSRRRFQRLIPLTRALGALAAALCVVLFSVDAMRISNDAVVTVPGGSAAMHLTTQATLDAAAGRPAAPEAARAVDAARASEAAPAATGEPARSAAPAAQPAAAFAPAATVAPMVTPGQIVSSSVTATPAAPAGALPRSAAPAPREGSASAGASAPSAPGAPVQPVAPQPATAATAPAQPAAQTAPAQDAVGAPATTTAPVQQPPTPVVGSSPWLSPLRLASGAFALLAASLLIASLVLSRLARRRGGARDERTRT